MSEEKKKEQETIEQIVNLLKEHPVIKKLFARFHVPIDAIHKIPIEFKDLDVSAKAKNGHIYLNKSFLEDGNFIDDIHYIVHEITHVLQQMTGKLDEYNAEDHDHYLDDPAEVEAFSQQIEFIDSYKSPEDADKYVDDLLDFHEIDGKARTEKRKQLRGT